MYIHILMCVCESVCVFVCVSIIMCVCVSMCVCVCLSHWCDSTVNTVLQLTQCLQAP